MGFQNGKGILVEIDEESRARGGLPGKRRTKKADFTIRPNGKTKLSSSVGRTWGGKRGFKTRERKKRGFRRFHNKTRHRRQGVGKVLKTGD